VRVLVTGAGGYVGGAVVRALAAAGHEPVALVRGNRGPLGPGVQVRVGDVTDPGTLPAAVAGVDAVCHLAGRTRVRESWDEPMDYFSVNAGGTIALLRAMDRAGVGRIVFASTGSVAGAPEVQPMTEDLPDDPPHPYAASKAAAEGAIGWQVRTGRLSAVVLRIFNVAGGGDPDPTRIVPRVLAVAAGRTARLEVNGDGTAVRDFVHVDDVAAGFVAATELDLPGAQLLRVNMGSGRPVSVMDVVAAVERVTGRTVPVVHNPPAAEAPTLVADPRRAAAVLGWTPARSELELIVRDEWSAR
jgi:nucleoside-diphosphate-sugar epimerase